MAVVNKKYELEAPERDFVRRLENFKIECPEYFNFATDVVDVWAERDRNKLEMIWVDQHGNE